MFLKTDCYRLGVISKLHSYKGEVTIYLDVDDPLEYRNLESVFVEYGNKLVPFFLERIAIRPNGQAVVKFEDVETERRAKTILKCGLYLPLDTLPELSDKEFYFHEIEGFQVIDENYGPIGQVIKIIDQANNPLIAIDHEGIEILIPNQKQFIQQIDRENKRLTITAPEGLIDMYLGSDEEEMSRPFAFKQFLIHQEANAQKVGSDSMLLGAWIEGEFNRILDIGTGTGILALMLAQKNPNAAITAIEPDLDSLNEALLNFKGSKFSHQFLGVQAKLQAFGAIEKFDLIVCNPPYFENAFLSTNKDRNRARHTDDLPVHELYECAAELLQEEGQMAIVIPTDEEYNHLKRAAIEGLFPSELLRTIKPDGSFKRSLIRFKFNDDMEPKTSELLVKNAQNEYSDRYIEMTKEFYLKDLKKIQSENK